MLNTDQRRYIEDKYQVSSQKTRNIVESWLERFSINEAEWGGDFTLQPREVLQPILNSIPAYRYDYAKAQLAELVSYAKWRKENDLPCGTGIFELVVDTAYSIRECMVSSPAHLERVLSTIFEPSNLPTLDVIYRVFLWSAFIGLQDNDAVALRTSDIDISNGTIRVGDKYYQMYDEAIKDFRRAIQPGDFYEVSRSRIRGVSKKFARADGDLIMRGKKVSGSTQEPFALKDTIRSRLSRVLKNAKQKDGDKYPDIPYDLSYQKAYLSGIFYRMLERDLEGSSIDFKELATEDVERKEAMGKSYSTSKSFTRQTIINRIAKGYETDYQNWKRSFYTD